MRGPFAITSVVLLLACLLTPTVSAAPADAAPCGGDFASWLQGVKQEAAGKGISQATIQSALSGVSYDRALSPAITPKVCSGRVSTSFPGAWCRREWRAAGA